MAPMRRSIVALLFLSLGLPAAAAAQTGTVDFSLSYRYMRVSADHHYGITPPTTVHSVPKGGEAGVAIRVAPAASVVATIGRGSSRPIVMPKGGIDSLGPNPSTGTVTFSVTD